jgi:hypothetical protein
MANRKQQTDKEVAESVQRVAEASKPAPKKPSSLKDFSLNPKAEAEAAVPRHKRAAADQLSRTTHLKDAAEEARMQGQKAMEEQSTNSRWSRPRLTETKKSNTRLQAAQVQDEREKSYAPAAPIDPKMVKRVKDRIKQGNVKPLTPREAGTDLTGTGGQKLTNEEGKKLKSYGDYSSWKRKSTDPKITRKGRK